MGLITGIFAVTNLHIKQVLSRTSCNNKIKLACVASVSVGFWGKELFWLSPQFRAGKIPFRFCSLVFLCSPTTETLAMQAEIKLVCLPAKLLVSREEHVLHLCFVWDKKYWKLKISCSMMKIHLKIKWAHYSILPPNFVIEIMLTQHLINSKTYLNDSSY